MIARFVEVWDKKKSILEDKFKQGHPDSYDGIVRMLVELLSGTHPGLDPERITIIDHGDYQGTRLYVIGSSGYQPDKYYYVYVNYGSCSGCDTFQSICGYGDEVSEENVRDYMTLALHILQAIKEMP